MSPRKARPMKPQQGKPTKASDAQASNSDRNPVLQRINKVLAAAGLGSRRQVDELIEQGRVEIDGQVVTQVGVKVDLSSASIVVDGELLKQHRPVYYALHKPEGVLCTNRDPQGRPRVIDFVPNQHRLFPVGRLDASSTGLILLTNDGELAQQLAHPKHEIPKRYAVVVVGQVELDALKRLERGIYLAEGKAQVDQAKLKKVRKTSTELEITLSEGKNREIRRVLARLGHKVVSLKRVAIGPLKLSDLPEGAYRPLSSHEVQGLYQAVDEIRRERKAARKARKKLAAGGEDSHSSNPQSVEGKPTKIKSAKIKSADSQRPGKPASKQWDKLPGLAQNPYATDEDLDESSMQEQDDDLVLIRDHGPTGAGFQESDDEYFFMPRQRTGSVIGQEDDPKLDEADAEGIEFELFDSEDDEDFDETPSPGKRGKSVGKPVREHADRRAGNRDSRGRTNHASGKRRSGGKSGGFESRGARSGSRSEYSGAESGDFAQERSARPGAKRGSNPRGSVSGGSSNRGATKRGGPKQGGPKGSGPKRGGPKSGAGKAGGAKRGGPKRGGSKLGGPKREGPKRGGPKRGGPHRGSGRSGRG